MTRFGAVLLQPGRAFRDLAAARKPLRTTAWILILTGLLWALTAAGFGLADAR